MKLNLYISIFILLISLNSFGDPIKIKGIIKSNSTGEPVRFVNIALVDANIGTTSDYDGYFELEINDSQLKSTLHLSCINYRNTLVEISKLDTRQVNIIAMEALTYDIPEVVVTSHAKKKAEITVNKLKKSGIKGYLASNNIPRIYARYFSFKTDYEQYSKITTLNMFFQSFQVNNKSKVRIRLFSCNTETNTPGNDLIQDDFIVIVKKGMNKIDISKFNVHIPPDGIFVGVEWLIIDENAYEHVWEKNGIKHSQINYGPILGANYYGESQTWLYWAGQWQKLEYKVLIEHPKIKPGSVFDAAISLTLTNR